jgi:hypothetical protein
MASLDLPNLRSHILTLLSFDKLLSDQKMSISSASESASLRVAVIPPTYGGITR